MSCDDTGELLNYRYVALAAFHLCFFLTLMLQNARNREEKQGRTGSRNIYGKSGPNLDV